MHICSKVWQSDHEMLGQVLYCLQKGAFLSLFSVNYHVALRVCFCQSTNFRMPNVGLIACVTREKMNKFVYLML